MREVVKKSRRDSNGLTQSSTYTRKTTVRPLKKVSTSLQIPNFQSLSTLSLFCNYLLHFTIFTLYFYIFREVIDATVPPEVAVLGQVATAPTVVTVATATLPIGAGIAAATAAAAAVMMHDPFTER